MSYYKPDKMYANHLLKSMTDFTAFDVIREVKEFVEGSVNWTV